MFMYEEENAHVDSPWVNWLWVKMETKDMRAKKRPPGYGWSTQDHRGVPFHTVEQAVSNCKGLFMAVAGLSLTFDSVAWDQLEVKL